MNHKIHIAYGFHVNCYHSYRGDTNDNLGFGSDIRIIRKILDVLTDFNEIVLVFCYLGYFLLGFGRIFIRNCC